MLKLKEKRLKLDMNQYDLSYASGVSQSVISSLESGKSTCSVNVLCKLCIALEVTPNELIKEEYWK